MRLVLAYPNRYWVAMSNLGFQTVHRLFSSISRYAVERAFIPDEDGPSIKTFEKNAPLSDAEIVAISVSFETDYLYVLRMIEAAGVKLERSLEINPLTKAPFSESAESERPERYSYMRPLILGGGAALTLNPEPLANFFDVIVIGEGEEVIHEISDAYLAARDSGLPFEQLLFQLSQISGVYVPSLYRVAYKTDQTIKAFFPAPGVTPRVERRFVANIDAFPTFTTIQTPNTEFRDMFMTETGRGCEVGCRFCVAGYMYRPTRKRSEEVIRETVQLGLETSQSIGFVGAAVSSHPKIAELASFVAQAGKRASLSSIMSQRVTPKLAASLSESEYKTVALAPEAGSEELRFRVGKRVCDQQILDGIATLAAEGIRNFKLYFIVGLPTESIADVQCIVTLVEKARIVALDAARRNSEFKTAPILILSINPFIPKAWTPFQRQPFPSFSEAKKRINLVRDGIRRLPNVEMKFESPRESYFQALVSRGDRRVGDVLLKLHREGGDWRAVVKQGTKELVSGVPPADFYVHRTPAADELLPWEIVDLRVKRSLLEREFEKTFSEDVLPLISRAKRSLAEEAAAAAI